MAKTQFPWDFKISKNLMRTKLGSLYQGLHHTRLVYHNRNMSADGSTNFKDTFQLCPFRIQFYSKSIWGVLIVWKALDWILWRIQGRESHPQGREWDTKTHGRDSRGYSWGSSIWRVPLLTLEETTPREEVCVYLPTQADPDDFSGQTFGADCGEESVW